MLFSKNISRDFFFFLYKYINFTCHFKAIFTIWTQTLAGSCVDWGSAWTTGIYCFALISLHNMTIFSFLISVEGFMFVDMSVTTSVPPPLLPMFLLELTHTHSNVQIYQERKIERGSEVGCVCVCLCERRRRGREGGRKGGRGWILSLSISRPTEKNRIVSSILGIKAKPGVIVATILTAADRPWRSRCTKDECVGVSSFYLFFVFYTSKRSVPEFFSSKSVE